jgi:hypothetical protein
LTLLLVLQAPKSGVPFRLYIAAEQSVIGVVLTQETDGKEYIVAYESRRLLDAEYIFIEKLCLSLSMFVPSCSIIYYLVFVMLHVKPT